MFTTIVGYMCMDKDARIADLEAEIMLLTKGLQQLAAENIEMREELKRSGKAAEEIDQSGD